MVHWILKGKRPGQIEQGNIWLRWEAENEKSKGFEIRRCVNGICALPSVGYSPCTNQ